MKRDVEEKGLIQGLRRLAHTVNFDKFMLMEYLVPTIDGCRAAFQLSLDEAGDFNKLTEDQFGRFIESTEPSLKEITICFKTEDTDDVISLVFHDGVARVYDECIEPDVVLTGKHNVLTQLIDSDSKISPEEEIGLSYTISGVDYSTIVESLGLLCFPPLLRVARSGIDPSSLLAEDADSIVIAAAQELVTNLVNRWVSLRLSEQESK